MAHFVKLENNVVVQGIVVSNKDTADEQGIEKEDAKKIVKIIIC